MIPDAIKGSGYDSIFIGKMGEGLFNVAITRELLSCYDSKQLDIGGWDFLVEDLTKIRRKITPSSKVFDPAIDFRVQLKSTYASSLTNGPTMSLQSLIDLVEQPSPAYVVYLAIGDDINEALIYHVGKKVIQQVTKKRKDAIAGGIPLNKIEITLPKDDGHLLVGPHPKFRDVFEALRGEFSEPYLENKMEFANSGGSNGHLVTSKIYDFRAPVLDANPIDLEPDDGSVETFGRRLYIDGRFPFRQDLFVFACSHSRVVWDNVPAFRMTDNYAEVSYQYREPWREEGQSVILVDVDANGPIVTWNDADTDIGTFVECLRALLILNEPQSTCHVLHDGEIIMQLKANPAYNDVIYTRLFKFAFSIYVASKSYDLSLKPIVSMQRLASMYLEDDRFRELAEEGAMYAKLPCDIPKGKIRIDIVKGYRLQGAPAYLERWTFWTTNDKRVPRGREIKLYNGHLHSMVISGDSEWVSASFAQNAYSIRDVEIRPFNGKR